MAKQDSTIQTTQSQKELLDLEKYYFSKLKDIITSQDFKSDLCSIEMEIKLNYTRLASTWNSKNKLKVAAERLVRHHVYKNMINDIRSIYESPISSDLGLVFDDCVLCVDCKTLDTESNSNDIKYTSVEPNQTSFDNSNHPYINVKGNLETRSRLNRRPVLTFIIKIIYRDNNTNFDISRSTNTGRTPSIILTCIPNGELSNLFHKDLVVNYKTYKYFDSNDGQQYTPVPVANKTAAETYCTSHGYVKITIPQIHGSKDIYWDATHHCNWTYTSNNHQKKLRAIKQGDSMRLNNEALKERLDSSNTSWLGYIEVDV